MSPRFLSRPLVRAVLLFAGCATVLATSPRRVPSETFPLEPRRITVLKVQVKTEQTYVQPPGLQMFARVGASETRPGGRLVGILSTTDPVPLEPNPLYTLDTEALYTPGQDLGPLGTVAFVLDIPFQQQLGGNEAPPLLRTSGTRYLTLFLQGGPPQEHEVSFALYAIEHQCGCKVEVETAGRFHPPLVHSEGARP